MNEQDNNYVQNLLDTDKGSANCKELLAEVALSKNLKQLISQNNKMKEKPRLYSGRSKSPKLNLYSYFKENINIKNKPTSAKKLSSATTIASCNHNQTNFKTNTKFNNINVETEYIKSVVVEELFKKIIKDVHLYDNKKNSKKNLNSKNPSHDLNSSSFCSKILTKKGSDELTIESIHTISKSLESAANIIIDDDKYEKSMFNSKIRFAPTYKNNVISNISKVKNESNSGRGNDIKFCRMIKKFKIIDDNINVNANNNNNNNYNINNNKLVNNNYFINTNKINNTKANPNANANLNANLNRGRIKIDKKKNILAQEQSLDQLEDEKIVNHSFLDVEEKKTNKQEFEHYQGCQGLINDFGDLRKKQSKSTSKYDKKDNMKFYKTGLAFNKVKLNCNYKDKDKDKDSNLIKKKNEMFINRKPGTIILADGRILSSRIKIIKKE